MMPLGAHATETKRYAVEVSGWDSSECFFVETCDLLWNEETGKRVTLNRKLLGDTVLFVRLLQSGHSERSHPVVYEAELLGHGPNGRNEFQLKRLPPKLGERGPLLK